MSATEKHMAALAEGGNATIDEAIEFTKLSRSDIYARMERGDLPYCKLGRRRFIPRRALVEMIQTNLIAR